MNYDDIIPQKIRDIKYSGIRKFFDIAASMPDVISLSVGEPDFKTPWLARKEAILMLEKGKTTYTSNSGIDTLRGLISEYTVETAGVMYDPKDEITVTVGGSEAIDAAIRVLIELGDEVLIPEPSFVCYAPLVQLAGGTPVPITTTVDDNFKLTPNALRAGITKATKALILPYPNNPTGAVMRKSELTAIADVLLDTNIIVISDEIYAEMTFGGERHCSVASLPGMFERTVVINGFSKAFAMPGWRLGYALAPRGISEQLLKIHQYGIMCAPTLSQQAAITALRDCRPDVASMIHQYDMRRKYLVHAVREIGLPCFEPEGAFYIFPQITHTGLTSQEFCLRLIEEERVAVVPGTRSARAARGLFVFHMPIR